MNRTDEVKITRLTLEGKNNKLIPDVIFTIKRNAILSILESEYFVVFTSDKEGKRKSISLLRGSLEIYNNFMFMLVDFAGSLIDKSKKEL